MLMRLVQTILGCLVLTLPGLAAGADCDGGRYLVAGDLEFSVEDDGQTVIVVTDDGVSMEPCGPALRSRVKMTRRGLVARAAWKGCGTAAGRITLKLRTSLDCANATGAVRSRKPRSRWRFEAERGCELAILCTPQTVPVDSNGDGCDDACSPAPGTCLLDSDCASSASDYCAREPGLCESAPGICMAAPEVCTSHWDPVCGCDGETYGNACDAAAAGVSVGAAGACSARTCGGLPRPGGEHLCPGDEFCDVMEGGCGLWDLPGGCVERSGVCPEVWNPVCSCNGTTYGNDCQRIAAGAQKDHDGACE